MNVISMNLFALKFLSLTLVSRVHSIRILYWFTSFLISFSFLYANAYFLFEAGTTECF